MSKENNLNDSLLMSVNDDKEVVVFLGLKFGMVSPSKLRIETIIVTLGDPTIVLMSFW